MPKPSKNPRVLRSRVLIREAVRGLLREGNLEALNVGSITERAGLNRSTFYLHYRDKDELLAHLMGDLLDELSIRSLVPDGAPDRRQRGLTEWFRHAAEHVEFYRLLLGPSGPRDFRARLGELLERRVFPEEAGAGDGASPSTGVPREVQRRFLTSACLGVLESWLEQRPAPSPEEMARWLEALATRPPR